MLIKILMVLIVVIVGSYLGHILICFLNRKLREYVQTGELDPAKLTQSLGIIERIIYGSFFAAGKDCYTLTRYVGTAILKTQGTGAE